MSRHTGVRAFVLFLASLISAGVLADTVERRVLNNGELVLEDVPEIPAELRRELYRADHRRQQRRGRRQRYVSRQLELDR